MPRLNEFYSYINSFIVNFIDGIYEYKTHFWICSHTALPVITFLHIFLKLIALVIYKCREYKCDVLVYNNNVNE